MNYCILHAHFWQNILVKLIFDPTLIRTIVYCWELGLIRFAFQQFLIMVSSSVTIFVILQLVIPFAVSDVVDGTPETDPTKFPFQVRIIDRKDTHSECQVWRLDNLWKSCRHRWTLCRRRGCPISTLRSGRLSYSSSNDWWNFITNWNRYLCRHRCGVLPYPSWISPQVIVIINS